MQRQGHVKLHKKLAILLALTLAISLIIAGCSGGGSGGGDNNNASDGTEENTSDGSTSKSSGNKVTVDFWVNWGGTFKDDYQKQVIDEFEKTHPNIKVNMTFVEGTDKLLTSIAGGNPPDVAILDRFMVGQWAAKGALESLTPYWATDNISPDDYYPGVYAEAVYNGEVYAMPWGTDDRAMYYNKTMMKEAGLDPEKPPTTIQELDQMAERMFKKSNDGKYEQVGFIPWYNQGFFYTQAWNWGGNWEKDGELTPNDPQNVKALEWMVSYAKKYDMSLLAQFGDMMGQTGMNAFWTGKVGFIFDGNWILNDLKNIEPTFEWGVAPMPSAEGYPHATWSGGHSFIMPKGAKHPKEAWELLKYIGGYEGTLLWAKRENAGNDITAMPKVNEELKLNENPNLKVFLDLMPIAKFRPVTPVGQFLWDETFRVTDLALNGKGEPKKLLDEVKNNVDNELAKVMSQ